MTLADLDFAYWLASELRTARNHLEQVEAMPISAGNQVLLQRQAEYRAVLMGACDELIAELAKLGVEAR